MAYVVARPRNRWEIRESRLTPAGPRSRTLASFVELSDEVLERARRAAEVPFDPDAVRRAARRAGARMKAAPQDSLATQLLRAISRGRPPRPGLSLLLRERLGGLDEDLADWIGATPAERGAALVDLLGLVDRLPKPRRSDLTFPGLSRSRLRD